MTNPSPSPMSALLFWCGRLADEIRPVKPPCIDTGICRATAIRLINEIFKNTRAISTAEPRFTMKRGEVEKPIIHSTRFRQLFDEVGITGDGAPALIENAWRLPL